MSFINFTTPTVAGSMSKAESQAKIRVSRTEEASVIMTGYIGAPRVKGEDGKYRASAYGRLPLQAAATGEGDKRRYVLEIAGGLRGVLFPAKDTSENKPDYLGNIDLGNGQEMALYGRKVESDNGSFISLSSGEAKAARSRNSNGGSDSSPPADSFLGDDQIPF